MYFIYYDLSIYEKCIKYNLNVNEFTNILTKFLKCMAYFYTQKTFVNIHLLGS